MKYVYILQSINEPDRHYTGIADQLVKDYNIPEEKSFEAARSLIGFYEKILNMISQQNVK